MNQLNGGGRYLLADSRHTPVARAVLENAVDAPNWQLRVLDDRVDEVMEHEVIWLAGIEADAPALMGRIIRCRGDRIVVEPVQRIEENFRENLRMPVSFDTYIYPVSGGWLGRRSVRSHDLSCGGVAFYSDQPLEDGEQMEIVIPITGEPLVLRCEVLRRRLSPGSMQLYAAKFVDLCDGEVQMVREAVFSVQLRDSGRNNRG